MNMEKINYTIITLRSGKIVARASNSTKAINQLAEKFCEVDYPTVTSPSIRNKLLNETQDRINDMVSKGTYIIKRVTDREPWTKKRAIIEFEHWVMPIIRRQEFSAGKKDQQLRASEWKDFCKKLRSEFKITKIQMKTWTLPSICR